MYTHIFIYISISVSVILQPKCDPKCCVSELRQSGSVSVLQSFTQKTDWPVATE